MKPCTTYSRNEFAHASFGVAAFFVMLAAFVVSLGLLVPRASAYAKDYACPSVSIDATVNADGSLSVTEAREFDFDGDFTAVWWELSNLPSDECEVTIDGVAMTEPQASGSGIDSNTSAVQALP